MVRSIARFYILAVGFAWLGWIPSGAAQAGILPVRIPLEVQVATQFGPSLAAFLLTGWAGGLPAIKRFLRSCLRWRISARWYIASLLLSPAIAVAVVLIHAVLGHHVPGWSDWQHLHAAYAESFAGPGPYHLDAPPEPSAGPLAFIQGLIAASGPLAVLNFVVFAILTGPVSEEFGWRGYVLPRLQGRYGALTSAVAVGALWGMWHTGPDFWRLLFEGKPAALLLPLWITLGTVPLSVLFSSMFNRTGGSLIPPMLCHASFNSTLGVLSLLWAGRPSLIIATELGAGIWIVAIVVAAAEHRARAPLQTVSCR